MSRRPYVREVSKTGWWVGEPRYVKYMARELSSLFIGAYALALAVGLYRLAQGPEPFAAWQAAMSSPLGVVFTIVTLLFAIYHTYTWFVVTPKAMPLVVGGKRVPGPAIVGGHWLGFVAVSGILWFILGAA